MVKPSNFIITTDFPTLKNDATGSADVVIPSSINIAGDGGVTYSTDLVMGSQGSVTRARFKSSVTDTTWHIGTQREFIRMGTVTGSPAIYSLYAFVYQSDANTIRCQVYIPNPYPGDTLTTSATGETISFYVNTFIPPFA